MTEICFATNNANKIKEIEAMLEGKVKLLSLDEIGCNEDLAEDQNTLQGNADQKASYVAKNFKINCFADDTGLEVHALNGEPGVYSARYAGPQRSDIDNIKLLLENLKGATDRSAQFRTVICAIINHKKFYFEGVAKGKIAFEISGEKGFGYDPIFIPDGHENSFAQMFLVEKNEISHRGKAVRSFVNFLKTNFL
ncbi:RdgB/HAM1 family non-canonical purine NTP pyrophosphatase [Marivirga sp. S37H4]|uniref:dITP/XTP pyrophosphatase n=1 Tax=Marivirga aurantiaca TaxID=2802615 RepID=A0A934WZR8_9BACT|nr:RdgB/HAM1 family non-canonical purine NTP pyrophosphatase [Marivirga aurantiaca]MBK6265877.1 RdgB/HAM1 family non-canonical purine NTP pyrophosphatase [Marivirga aurantiaca]